MPPEKLAIVKRLARTSPTAAAALGLENRPQSNEFLMQCSAVDAVAIKSPVARSTMLAVMNLTEMKSFKTSLVIAVEFDGTAFLTRIYGVAV